MDSETFTIMVAAAKDGLTAGKTVRLWAPGLDGAPVTALDWIADTALLKAAVADDDEGDHYFEAEALLAVRVAEAGGP